MAKKKKSGGRPSTKNWEWPTGTSFVKAKSIKVAAKSKNLRTSKEFIAGMSKHVEKLLRDCLAKTKDNKVKTLTPAILREVVGA